MLLYDIKVPLWCNVSGHQWVRASVYENLIIPPPKKKKSEKLVPVV